MRGLFLKRPGEVDAREFAGGLELFESPSGVGRAVNFAGRRGPWSSRFLTVV